MLYTIIDTPVLGVGKVGKIIFYRMLLDHDALVHTAAGSPAKTTESERDVYKKESTMAATIISAWRGLVGWVLLLLYE